MRTLVQEMHKYWQLREQLQLDGTIMFESHTNLGNFNEPSNEDEVVQISEHHMSRADGRKHKAEQTKGDKRYIAQGENENFRERSQL